MQTVNISNTCIMNQLVTNEIAKTKSKTFDNVHTPKPINNKLFTFKQNVDVTSPYTPTNAELVTAFDRFNDTENVDINLLIESITNIKTQSTIHLQLK